MRGFCEQIMLEFIFIFGHASSLGGTDSTRLDGSILTLGFLVSTRIPTLEDTKYQNRWALITRYVHWVFWQNPIPFKRDRIDGLNGQE